MQANPTSREHVSSIDRFIETVPIPDQLLRVGIRSRLRHRLKEEFERYQSISISNYAEWLRTQPIKVPTDHTVDQQYQVPFSFFTHVTGKHRKYSCGLFKFETESLDDAEKAMLELTCERANLWDGGTILELGCGWGSMTMYMAQKYPHARILAVSDSAMQTEYIQGRADELGLTNIEVLTEEIEDLEMDGLFDRIVSVEAFEHVRNYESMFAKLSRWLKPDGRIFLHVFGHNSMAYSFNETDSGARIAPHFFSGAQMPSRTLFHEFQNDIRIVDEWVVNGMHYAMTCRRWRENLDTHKTELMDVLREEYGEHAKRYWTYWRLFFMACEEFFSYNEGDEWQVYHFLFAKTA